MPTHIYTTRAPQQVRKPDREVLSKFLQSREKLPLLSEFLISWIHFVIPLTMLVALKTRMTTFRIAPCLFIHIFAIQTL